MSGYTSTTYCAGHGTAHLFTCTYPERGPILSFTDGPTGFTVSAGKDADPADALRFADNLLAAAQEFRDATVAENERLEATRSIRVAAAPAHAEGVTV